MSEIKILVVDDHPLVREGIISMLGQIEDFTVVGEAPSGKEAVNMAKTLDPDIILMDIILGDINGIEAARRIKRTDKSAKIIFLSMDLSEKYIKEAIQIDASGYIPKDISKDDLVAGIRKALDGKKFFTEQVSDIIFEEIYKKSESKHLGKVNKALTNREVEVLIMIANGVPNKEIAERLFISVRTVDAHRNNILHKLKLASTADLVKYAIKNNYTSLD